MQSPRKDSNRLGRWGHCSPIVRRAAITAVLLLMSAPLILRGSDLGLQTMFNAPLLWIDHDADSRREFNEFLELFGSHEMIVVSWPGCSVDDDGLVKAAEALEDVRAQRDASGQPTLFNHVLTGNTMLKLLMDRPIDLSREAALNRLQGVLVGADGKTSCIVIELTDQGGFKRRETIPIVIDAITSATGISPQELVLSGPAIDGMAIDVESIRSLQTYSLPSILISLVLCWVCLRSFWLTLPIVIIAAWGQGLMLAAVYYGGSTMNAVLIVLPALIFVLTVSAGVHLANYFLEELNGGSVVDAPSRALMKAKGPCTLAAVTTSIGLASLCISEVEPVRQFGFLGATGVLICVALLFLLVPGFMAIMLNRSRGPKRRTMRTHATGQSFAGLSRVIFRFGWIIRWLCIAAMVVCGAGLSRLRTSIDVVSLLSDDNRAVRDFHWVQENIGPLVPIEVVVHFDRQCELDTLERLKVVAAVQHQISEMEVLDGEMSAVTFIPVLPNVGGLAGTVRKRIFLSQIEKSREGLIAGKYLAETADGEAWRISGRILGQSDFDYGRFLDRLQSEVDFVLDKVHSAGYSGVTASSTGVLVLVYQIQEVLLDDLFNSFLTALALVAIVMMVALRSVIGGLLAMLPNVFPTILLFGAMGWNGRTIDIGSVMTASVALGIAVDGTFHFLKWFVNSLKEGATREEAITIAYQRCGRALVQTTLICTCGLLIYSFSGFLPARNFAWVLLMMLTAALFGDMILLPALLAGRLGRSLRDVYQPDDLPALTTPDGVETGKRSSPHSMPRSNSGANLPS